MRKSLTLSAKEQQRSEVVSRWLAGVVTTDEAVALLGVSERTAWRLRAAMVTEGAAGLAHGNRGRASPRRIPDAVRSRIVALATTTYRGYNDSHLAEALADDEGIRIGRSTLRRLLRAKGIASPRTHRASRYRSRRERMAQAGLLVQVDGSRHDWLEGRGPELTLVGGIDDATGLVPGGARAGATDRASANAVLRDFLPRFNRRFAVPAANDVPAWRPVPDGVDLARVCAFRWRRAVGSDGCVRLEGMVLQLPPGPGGRSLATRRVELGLRLDADRLTQQMI